MAWRPLGAPTLAGRAACPLIAATLWGAATSPQIILFSEKDKKKREAGRDGGGRRRWGSRLCVAL